MSIHELNREEYLMPGDVEVRAVGHRHRLGRGTLKLFLKGKPIGSLNFGAAVWFVLRTLIERALASASTDQEHAFLSASQLEAALARHPDFEPGQAIRHIFRLRKAIRNSAFARDTGKPQDPPFDWGLRFIESDPALGYRISVPPENITLILLDNATDDD